MSVKRKTPRHTGKTAPFNRKEKKKPLRPDERQGNGKPAVKGSGSKNSSHFPGTEMPAPLSALICSYITEKTGKNPDDPGFLSRLRQSVMAQKASYWQKKPGMRVKYGKAYDIFAYLAYHLPVYYTQFRSIVQELENEQNLPEKLIVLDIGTGPGVIPLALIDLVKNARNHSLEIFSVERSDEHRAAFNYLVHAYADGYPGVLVHDPISGDLVQLAEEAHPDLPGVANLITFQNVLAELEHLSVHKRAEIVRSYARLLSDDGFIIIVEPAELRHATSLRLLQGELMKGGLQVYAPCSYLWGSGCSPTSCWTFREDPPIVPTDLMVLLAGEEEGYRFLNTDVKYSYLILSKNQVFRNSYRIPKKNRMVRLSHLERYSRRIVHVTAALMSGDIGTRGMHIFKVCDGTCREPVYVVLSGRNRRPGHAALFKASYGGILIFSNVQVRRHPVHPAYNIIIGPESRIETATSVEKKTCVESGPSAIFADSHHTDVSPPSPDTKYRSQSDTDTCQRQKKDLQNQGSGV